MLLHDGASPFAGRFRAPALLSAIAAAAGIACSGSGAAPTADAAATASASASATASATATGKPGPDIKPLYPVDNAPPDPRALRFCEAIHDQVPRRRGECCGTPQDRGYFTAECARVTSAVLRLNAATLDEAAIDRCVEAMARETEGCGWVGPEQPPLPADCQVVIQGKLEAGAVCRSALECKGTLACQGLTATQVGRCGPSKPAGFPCGGSVDTLAAMTRQNRTEATHPECEGYCGRRCADTVKVGEACGGDNACGPKARCLKGKCSEEALPAAGHPCIDGRCALDARCVKNACIAPKNEGEACESDLECRAACEKGDGGTAGKCGKRCAAPGIPTGPGFPLRPQKQAPKK